MPEQVKRPNPWKKMMIMMIWGECWYIRCCDVLQVDQIMALLALSGLGPPHYRGFTTPQSVVLLWTSDQPDAETSTWQHATLTTDRHPCPGGIRIRNSSKRVTADQTARPLGST
jgi:hypothetical protein